MRKLVRIGSNVKIPGDSHYKNKNIVLTLLKKIEMRKMTMPNFCINFLNKAAKLLPILYDFTVASLMDAWIKIIVPKTSKTLSFVASFTGAWIKIKTGREPDIDWTRRIPRGCVD